MTTIRIGLDAGVNTGFAKVFDGVLREVKSMCIVEAMDSIASTAKWARENSVEMIVYIEDARKRKWVTGGREKLQGVGSVKRDCSIWQSFCEHHDIVYELVAPKDNKTKLDSKTFQKYTGWKQRTNQHGRDAAMLVVGRSCSGIIILDSI